MEQFSPNIVLDGICLVAVIIVAFYNFFCMKKGKNGTGYVFFVFFILLFSLYYRPADGDFWSYLESYQLGSQFTSDHWEPFYCWLQDMIPDNFLLWRVSIWLPAGIVIALIYKKMNITSSYATVFFLSFALVQYYYYLRNILGLSILCYAIVIYCSHHGFFKQKSNILISFILLYVSCFFHKSMPVYIVFALLAIVLPYKRNYILWSLVLIPFLYGLVLLFSTNFIDWVSLWDTNGKGLYYIESENTFSINWKGIIDMFIQYLPIFYFYIIAFQNPLPKNNSDYSFFKVFLLFSFFLLYLSFLFYGQGSITLQKRFLMSSMFPFAFTVGVFFKNNIRTIWFHIFTYLTIILFAWKLFLLVVLVV